MTSSTQPETVRNCCDVYLQAFVLTVRLIKRSKHCTKLLLFNMMLQTPSLWIWLRQKLSKRMKRKLHWGRRQV